MDGCNGADAGMTAEADVVVTSKRQLVAALRGLHLDQGQTATVLWLREGGRTRYRVKRTELFDEEFEARMRRFAKNALGLPRAACL
jgi:hypothetical protein